MNRAPGKMDQPVVKVENLAIAYETRGGDVHAVRDVSFSVGAGRIFGVLGASGTRCFEVTASTLSRPLFA